LFKLALPWSEIREPQAAGGALGAQSLKGSSMLGLGTEDTSGCLVPGIEAALVPEIHRCCNLSLAADK